MSKKRADLLVYLLLTVAVLAVFLPTLGHDFVNYDDDAYVTENPHVVTGLTLGSIEWAFAAMYECNWHPVTWLSHMLDCTLFHLRPMGHHLTNLLIHLASTLLLFAVLRRMTKSLWPSAFVAMLFGVHPLHVESVAWVSQRKDLLCAFFWILTMWAYARYAERPSPVRYLLVVSTFALGLMSKPMIVTLPFVLLLLDYWPLGRFASKSQKSWGPLILEKVPLFALSAASCVVTYLAQAEGLAVGPLDQLPMGKRIANAAIAYVVYMGKMVYPTRLAVFYPHPGTTLPTWHVLGSGLLLLVITVGVLLMRTRPYLLVGWLWYLGTLIPAIGIVQVGWQAMADRYTYMPLVGLFIMVSWGIAGRVGERENGGMGASESPTLPFSLSPILLTLACAATVLLAISARHQVRCWKNSMTLFEHALEVTKRNPVAENNLAIAFASQGKTDEAIVHHRRALQIKPDWADAHFNLGNTLLAAGRTDEAILEFRKTLEIFPRYAQALNNLGAALMEKGEVKEAGRCFMETIRIRPDHVRAYMNLGTALSELGKWNQAIASFRTARELRPEMPETHHNLAITLAEVGRRDEAIAECREALRLRPNWSEAENSLAWMLATQERPSASDSDEAIRLAESACRATRYKNLVFLDTLIRAYASAERFADAARAARQAAEVAKAAGRADDAKRLSATSRLYESLGPRP